VYNTTVLCCRLLQEARDSISAHQASNAGEEEREREAERDKVKKVSTGEPVLWVLQLVTRKDAAKAAAADDQQNDGWLQRHSCQLHPADVVEGHCPLPQYAH
jgi:hypothetical protein